MKDTLNQVAMELLSNLIKAGMPYEKAIAFVCGYQTTTADNKSAYKQPKVDTTKGAKKVSKVADKSAKEVAYGKVKKGDFVKVVNLNTNKVVAVGKAKKVLLKDKIVVATSGKKFALENCVAINETTYNKLKKSLKVSKANVSTSKKLSPADFKKVYCVKLAKQGLLNENDFAKAKDNAEYRSELYKQFKNEVKLTNAEALKLFAENTAKAVA